MNSSSKLGFSKGILCLPLGLKETLFDSKLFIYAVIPFFLSLLVVYFGFYYGWSWTDEYLKQSLHNWLGGLISEDWFLFKVTLAVLKFIFKLIWTLIVIYLGFVLVQIFSSPFYSLICEHIFEKRGVFPKRKYTFGIWLRLNLRQFFCSVFRMIIFMLFGIIVFIFSFIPGLQFLALFYAGFVIAVDSMDYSLELYEVSLRRRFVFYFTNFKFFLGLTTVLLPSLFIPGLTILLLPIAVVGSAVCFADTKGKSEYEKLIA